MVVSGKPISLVSRGLAECVGGLLVVAIACAAKWTVGLGDVPFTILVVLGFAGFDRRILRDYLRLSKGRGDAGA